MEQGKKTMPNWVLLIFTLIAGSVWWFIGEFFFPWARNAWGSLGKLQNSIINGLYFSLLTVLTIAACLWSESLVPSIVNREYFKMAVAIPPLKIILAISFVLMFLGAGVLQFIYEFDVDVKKTQANPQTGFDDYYFLVDNTGSMEWNDPHNERLTLLSRIIDDMPESKKIALVSFNVSATMDIPLQFADRKVKDAFKRIKDTLHSDSGTDIIKALTDLSKMLDNDPGRRGVVIFISDGGQSEEVYYKIAGLNSVIRPFVSKNIPIYSIMLTDPSSKEDVSDGIALLQRIASATGGRQSTVSNFIDLESEVNRVTRTVQAQLESKRNLLLQREGNSESSLVYSIMHIVFIALIGLFMGFLVYMVFTHRDILKPMLISGFASGLLSGLLLEFGLQNYISAPLVRAGACVLLSVILWALYTWLTQGRTGKKVLDV